MNQEASSHDSPLAIPSNYSPPQLSSFEGRGLVIADDGVPGGEAGGSPATCGILPCFPAVAAALSETCSVCVGVSLPCTRIGSSGVSNVVTIAMQ